MCSILFNANSNSKELWNEKINKGLSKIKSIPTGELLITTIDTIIKNNRGSVTIQPRERYYSGSNSYPKITYYNGKNDINIIIPDEPYRTMVKVIDQNFINKCFINKKNVDISAKYLAYICNLIEVPYEIIINKGIKKNEKKHMIIVDGFCFEEDKKQNNVYTFMVGLRPRLAKLVAIWSFGARGTAVVIAGDWRSGTRRIP